jgi:hypothetical protein
VPQALEAVREDMQEKAPDKLMSLQAHGLHLITLASIAIREADAAVTDIPEAMLGHRDAVGRAAQRVKDLGWSCARLLGLHHPRLALEWVEEVGEACGSPALGCLLGAAPRLFAVGLV